MTCLDTVTYHWATAMLKDTTSNTTTKVLPKTCVNPTAGWKQVTKTPTAVHNDPVLRASLSAPTQLAPKRT